MAIYKSDMLEFCYDASLHIHHPSVGPDAISAELQVEPERTHLKNDARSTPTGHPLAGTYADNFWTCKLPTEDQTDVSEFLKDLVIKLKPHRQFLKQLAETDGEICVFIGLFSDSCCAHQFPNQLLSGLADTGLDLRLDFYGPKSPQEVGGLPKPKGGITNG